MSKIAIVMSILTDKNFKFILTASVASVVTTLTFAPEVKAVQFNFNSGQGTSWDHSAVGGDSNFDGWQPLDPNNLDTTQGYSQGTATKDGITLTVESTFVGGALPDINNLYIQSGDTQGFGLKNKSNSDLNSGSLTKYQRIDLVFNKPVIFDTFGFADIDSVGSFTDAVGAEGFVGSVGSIGTGIDPVYNLTGSELIEQSISGINYVRRDNDRYGRANVASDSLLGRAGIEFTEGVTAASLYFFNDQTSASDTSKHGINWYNSVIEVREVPFEFSPTLGIILSGTIFVGLKIRQARKTQSQPIIEE